MIAWDIVDQYDYMNSINLTWDFKYKRYPDGLIKDCKAQFFARGNQQLEVIYFFETYAPVVQCTTVWFMLIIKVVLGFKPKQCDTNAAFIHADIHEDEKLYDKMPRGFEQLSKNEHKKCLKLKKILYGLCQSPREFWKYMTKKLEQSCMKE